MPRRKIYALLVRRTLPGSLVPTGIVKESANGSAYLLSPIVVNTAWIEHGKAVYNTDKWGHRCPLAWVVGVSGPITMGLTSSTALKVPLGLNIPGETEASATRHSYRAPCGVGLVWVPGRAHPQAHDGLQTYQLDGRVLAYRGDDGYRGLGFDPGEVA